MRGPGETGLCGIHLAAARVLHGAAEASEVDLDRLLAALNTASGRSAVPELSLWTELLGSDTVGSYVDGEILPGAGEEVTLVDPSSGTDLVAYADGGREAVDAAAQLTPSVLELGGTSANMYFADADLDRAVAGAAAAVFSGAGQSCVAGSRLLVHLSVHDQVVEKLAALAASLRQGDATDPATQVGPIQNRAQLERIAALVGEAAPAADVLTGGATLNRPGFFFPPTLLAGVSNTDPIAQQEVFGPVVAAIPFEDEEEAIALANTTDFGLAGAVWTSAVDRAHRVARALRAGTVWVNSYKTINVMAPFGGFGHSGSGRSSGHDGLLEYSTPKAVWVETDPSAPLAFGY